MSRSERTQAPTEQPKAEDEPQLSPTERWLKQLKDPDEPPLWPEPSPEEVKAIEKRIQAGEFSAGDENQWIRARDSVISEKSGGPRWDTNISRKKLPLWKLVAMSCGIGEQRLLDNGYRPGRLEECRKDLPPLFYTRMCTAIAELSDETGSRLQIATKWDSPEKCEVKVSQFLDLALALNWNLPKEMDLFEEGQTGRGSLASDRTSWTAVPKYQIVNAFRVSRPSYTDNMEWWTDRMRNATRYGLAIHEIGASTGRGSKASTFYVAGIARWLVEKEYMDAAEVVDALRSSFSDIPECEQIIDYLEVLAASK